MNLLSPDSGTLFWTVITFLLLLFILKRYAWKPILTTLENREKRIKDALAQAEQDRKSAQQLVEEQKQLLEKSRRDSAQILAESKKNAEATRKELLEHARNEADKILARARQEMELSKEAAISDIKQYAVEIALAAAQKVVGEAITPDHHLQLIDKYVKQMGPQS